MTMHRFYVIARKTTNIFWPLCFQFLEHAEVSYLKNSKAARIRLELAIAKTLADALLNPSQMALFVITQSEHLAELADKDLPSVDEPFDDAPDVDTEAPRQN